MMLEIFGSPSALLIFAAVLTVVALQLAGDFIEFRQHVGVKRLTSRSKTPPRSVVSVIIDAKNQSVFSTLANLELNTYKNIEVIVFYTGRSNNLLAKLRGYQRKSKFKNFRIITARRGLSQAQFVKKYSMGSIVMHLSGGDTITPEFIKENVVLFRDNKLQAVSSNTALDVNNTLKSALRTSRITLSRRYERVFAPKIVLSARLSPGVLYRKTTIINGDLVGRILTSINVSHTFLYPAAQVSAKVNNPTHNKFTKLVISYIPLTVLLALIYLVERLEGANQAVFTLRALSVLAVVFGLLAWQNSTAKSFSTKLSILLLSPFALIAPK